MKPRLLNGDAAKQGVMFPSPSSASTRHTSFSALRGEDAAKCTIQAIS